MRPVVVLLTVLLASCYGTEVSEEVDYEPVSYQVRRSHAGWRVQEYYPDVNLTAHVFMESANREARPIVYDGHDLATLHLIWAYAWRDVVGADDDLVAQCLERGIIYVPEDDESFARLCDGDLSRFGCYHFAEVFGVEGLANYVQVVRWDWYNAMGNPAINAEYNEVFAHEAAHHIAHCMFGTTDAGHELDILWEEVVPLAAEYERQWLRDNGRMDE